jgi:hypothetical protein
MAIPIYNDYTIMQLGIRMLTRIMRMDAARDPESAEQQGEAQAAEPQLGFVGIVTPCVAPLA